MDSIAALKEKLEDMENEKKELKIKLRSLQLKKEALRRHINKCGIFDEAILFLIAELMTFKEEETYIPFIYKKYNIINNYPIMLSENTYIGIAKEKNITEFNKFNNNNIDKFMNTKLGYEIYQIDHKTITPDKDYQSMIVDSYNYTDLKDNKRAITFGFLLNEFNVINSYNARYSHTNFNDYPYVQDFIVYLFNLQVEKNGKQLKYEEMCNAYNDFISLKDNKTKTKRK